MFYNSSTVIKPAGSITLKGEIFDFSSPKVMGVVNLSPDSFYDGGRYLGIENAVKRVEQLVDEGADIIDIGAVSTRPGAVMNSAEEEIYRLKDKVAAIRNSFPDIIISIDTVYGEVAKMMVEEFGVDIINDVSAGEVDETMFETIAQLHVPYILMHMKGMPSNMQNEPFYENVMLEVFGFLSDKITKLRKLGVVDLIIDPGFGFGKTVDHNYQLLRDMDDFKVFELPLLVGISRKSMISKSLGITAEDSLNGTTALHMAALLRGANMLRVHDVKEAKECITLYNQLLHK